MLEPKKSKYRYQHKASYEGQAKGNKKLRAGQFGLQVQEGKGTKKKGKGSYITNEQIEAARKVISHYTKKFGKMLINVFPHQPLTKKPSETRMGSGKGSVTGWVAVAKKGTVIFEINELPKDIAYRAFKVASSKLPVKCKVIEKS
jgi:large subunit ribosomal protein L16